MSGYQHHLDVQQQGNVIVVRFGEHRSLDGWTVDKLKDELSTAADREGCHHLVLDFSGVAYAWTKPVPYRLLTLMPTSRTGRFPAGNGMPKKTDQPLVALHIPRKKIGRQRIKEVTSRQIGKAIRLDDGDCQPQTLSKTGDFWS
jgi:hypothetical protein